MFCVLLIPVLVGDFVGNSFGLDVNCQHDVMDTCSNRLLMLGDEKFIFPNTTVKMNQRCRDIRQQENCMKEYSKNCLNGITRQSIAVLAFSISQTNKNYCSNKKQKNAFVAFGNCLNKNFKPLNRAINSLNRRFHAIKTYKTASLRVPLACCNYYQFKEEVLNIVDNKCPKHTPEVENIIDGFASSILNLLCGDYVEDSDKCKRIIGNTPNGTNKKPNWKSIVLSLAEILESV